MSWSQDSTDFSTQTQQGLAVKAKPGYQDGALKHHNTYIQYLPPLQMPKTEKMQLAALERWLSSEELLFLLQRTQI